MAEVAPSGGRRPGWRDRATGVVVAWSALYTVLGVYWVAGGRGYPFGRNDLHGPESGSLLAGVGQSSSAPALLLVALVASGTAWAMHGRVAGPAGVRAGVGGAGALIVVLLVVVAMDSRSITLLPPLGLVGWLMIRDWPTLNQLLLGVGALGWIAATAAYVTDTGTRAAGPGSRRWVVAGNVGVVVAVLCPLPYAVIRWSWALDRPIGAPRSFVEMLGRNQPGVAAMEATLAVFACLGALLTAGLVMGWGQTFPRWLPRVGGTSVPLWFPLSLGTSAAVAIFPFGRGAWHSALGIDIAGTQDQFQLWGLDIGRPAFWGVGGLGWLFPAWACALGVALVGYWHRRRPLSTNEAPPAHAPGRRWRGALIGTAAGLFGAGLAMAALPEHGETAGWIVPYSPSLPRPTGPSPVGVRDVHLVDAARQEPLASPPGPRELMARVYYPAAARPAGGASLRDHAVAPYVSEPIALEWGREQSRMLGVRSDAVNWQFRTNAHLHTPPAAGRFPVVIATPPLGRHRSSYTFMAEDLASHGYVVVVLDHTYEGVVEFPGRRIVRPRIRFPTEDGTVRWHRARAEDVEFVAAHLDQLGGELAPMVDRSRLGVLGYVPLGCEEFDGLARGSSVAAFAVLGTNAWCRANPVTPAQPVLLVRGEGDPSAGAVEPEPDRPAVTTTGSPRDVCTDANAYLPELSRQFPDARTAVAGGRGRPDRASTPSRCREIVRAFFDLHVGGSR